MEKTIKDKHGSEHRIGLYDSIHDGKTEVWIDNVLHTLSVGYRPERTWDDHMGNTCCGYFVNVPLTKTEHKIIYLFS